MNNLDFELMIYEKVRKKNLSYTDVANMLGISKGYLSQIIRGKRKATKIKEKLIEMLERRENDSSIRERRIKRNTTKQGS